MRAFSDQLYGIIEPAVAGLGYELIGIQYLPGRKRALVRAYIDHPAGVGLGDCEQVSRQISGVLDVENPIRGQYSLEVSSPGLDRPLFKSDHFRRFAGYQVRIKFDNLWEGRRNVTGELLGCQSDIVLVRENGVEHEIPLDSIGLARLVSAY
uniref:Ribosome maturation factor RimP n=1 Tax=Candidatus Kentrum sp. LPFa TaxID=2126335 RepID=A0A450W2W3_9GAMM|nr:MAG: ribosome maturation factor RimP [Candidatus Kentron sp. LPFa]VFK16047.1 MAG: ribosome maturation factor RimP [Candidatus Kentron sp. LPFa]VFK27603.1 MAG: ribosome maturation factor RimP [Candidatus Kentron sp. LPFa]